MYVCAYCHAQSDTPRCDNCGAPTEGVAQPAVVGRRDLRLRPLINEPWTEVEIADAFRGLALDRAGAFNQRVAPTGRSLSPAEVRECCARYTAARAEQGLS
jgi:hypothetical protein